MKIQHKELSPRLIAKDRISSSPRKSVRPRPDQVIAGPHEWDSEQGNFWKAYSFPPLPVKAPVVDLLNL